ncbi:MAG: acyl-CoA dehydrogenase [Candidatus Carbobacillus altaicus]|uniref:Acyl-CoA dehydrogenase n=1 Tax=Candidatus Carbonibacillus altaicus TaxID=2163959 RepID=A0A2R6Y452_9BACL|nr:acyl-CoA dehydrogenase [Candidatus Carbobacillus altaicus]PTQ57432.1 MAG: Butyryl-CoA dehydrogenase [Candidatus Carbobacillus altaicus]
MDFQLTEEQKDLIQMVRAFAQKEVAKEAALRDEEERYDPVLFKRLSELGLTGIPFAETYGGAGSDHLTYAMVVEALAEVDASLAVVLSAHTSLASWPIDHYGDSWQKEQFLRPLAEGRMLGAYALTEPEAGSDAAHLKTRAVREGDTYILNGEKVFITNGMSADIIIVFATTDPALGHRGISAFIVEKEREGFRVGRKEKKMGIRASETAQLMFEDVRIPVQNRLGEEGEGFKIAMSTLDGGRIGIAAQALGIAVGAFQRARAYAMERRQFGRPIAEFEAIRFKLADMATRIEAARYLTYYAAWLKDAGRSYGMAASQAKLFASDTAMWVTTEAVQIFGGYGYMRDYEVERMMRDAKITQIYEGTNEIQRLVIASHLFPKRS